MRAIKRFFSGFFSSVALLFRRARLHSVGASGAQTAFFFILAIFPFIIFINTVIASLNIPKESAIDFLNPIFPDQIVSFLSNYLDTVNAGGGMSVFSIGVILALFTASKSVRTLTVSFDRAYDSKSSRSFFVEILFSILFILLFALIIIACIILVALGNDFITKALLNAENSGILHNLVDIWRWSTTSLILFFSISLMYKLLPSKKISFSETIPGTLFALLGFLVLTGGFSLYVNKIAPASLFFGSIGTIILFMLWMYFIAIILILGAELNNIITNLNKNNTEETHDEDL